MKNHLHPPPPHPNASVSDIELEHTPNIHVIMFDALINSEFSEEFLDQRSVGADYLAQLDDSIYAGKTGFVEGSHTIATWDALFGLGIRERGYKGSLHFSGAYPSPLSALLRKNGYMIQTGFANGFFGLEKGPYVDHYYIESLSPSKSRFSHVPICRERILGLCNNRLEFIYQKIYGLQYGLSIEGHGDKSWTQQIFDIIEEAEHAKTPVFSGFYILMPGHVSGNMDREEYKLKLSSEAGRVRAALQLINELRLKFPESIFIVSGDHGAFLFYLSPPISSDENSRLWTLDRHSVALSLLNEHNLCPMSRDWLERQRYLTPSRLLAAALACNGDSQKLLEIFSDREEFITFGESLRSS